MNTTILKTSLFACIITAGMASCNSVENKDNKEVDALKIDSTTVTDKDTLRPVVDSMNAKTQY
jgi:hypothetical protein